MAYIKQNIIMNGVAGTIAKQMTLRVRKGKTIMSAKRGPDTVPPTELQLDARNKFEDALMYAAEAITDPVKKLMYAAAAKGGQSAYNAAFRDATMPPKIVLVDTAAYNGMVGDIVAIAVRDVVRVRSVKVTILSSAGVELEQGEAVAGKGDAHWNYTATATNPALPGTRILITATDLPGNSTDGEKVIV